MYQAEALFRQGSWVRKFEDQDQAFDWAEQVDLNEANTVNPVRQYRVFNLADRPQLHPPVAPSRNADELLTDEEFWNK